MTKIVSFCRNESFITIARRHVGNLDLDNGYDARHTPGPWSTPFFLMTSRASIYIVIVSDRPSMAATSTKT